MERGEEVRYTMTTCRRGCKDPFLKDEGGYTTLTVAVSLMLAVVLLVSAAQVKWVQGEAPNIQFVADSAALSAENVVADFYTISRVADAVTLSVSLVALTMYGTAIVMCCIPGGAGKGAELMASAARVSSVRDRISDSARKALNKLQKALPYICMLNAAATVEKNAEETGAGYVGTAIPFPFTGDGSFPELADISDATEELEDNGPEIAQYVAESEQYAKAMNDALDTAYEADCGADPDYCMYQRAATLANMSGVSNPYYSSVDAWTFSVPLQRARAYYSSRLMFESPDGSSSEDKTKSECRKVFYRYASEALSQGYVSGEGESFDVYFPLLPVNTDEMRQTSMYDDFHWWASSDGVLHGTPECSSYASAGAAGKGSLRQLDAGTYSSCEECGLFASTLGKVGSPSSSIENGFEYHYRIVAEQADIYEENCHKAAESERKAKELAERSFEKYGEAMTEVSSPSKRYDPKPPGRYGCIAVVVDTSSHDAPGLLSSSLMGSNASIGPRVAISGAALGEDVPEDGQNILSSMLDGLCQDAKDSGSGALVGSGFDWVFDLWGWALSAYSNGMDSFASGMERVVDAIPGLGESGLGAWAKGAFTAALTSVGLEPAKLSSPKPLTINTSYILEESNERLANALQAARAFVVDGESWDSVDFETLGKMVHIDFPENTESVLESLDEVLGRLGGG